MTINDTILRVVARKFVLSVMIAIGDRTMGYIEIQRATNAKPVPLARALKSLVLNELAKREEIAGGRVNYTLTARGRKALKFAQEIVKI
jgi:DNA-binding HxlR family transcriptional regulator